VAAERPSGVARAAAGPAWLGRWCLSAVEHGRDGRAPLLDGWVAVRSVRSTASAGVQFWPLDALLPHPTRLVSVIWGQSEVGTLQPIEAIWTAPAGWSGVFTRCGSGGGHQPIQFRDDAGLTCSKISRHKLIKATGHRVCSAPGLELLPLLAGGGQEAGGRRTGGWRGAG